MQVFKETFEKSRKLTEADNNVYVYDGTEKAPKDVTHAIIADGVTAIADNAFTSCKLLKKVEIPNSVITIGFQAFSNCVSLTRVDIPNSVKHIDSYAFYGCSRLTDVNMPNPSNISLGSEVFGQCKKLSKSQMSEPVLGPLDFDSDYMGEPLCDWFIDVLDSMQLCSEPSIQGGTGSDYVMNVSDDSIAFVVDYAEECAAMQNIYKKSSTEAQCKAGIKKWVEDQVKKYKSEV